MATCLAATSGRLSFEMSVLGTGRVRAVLKSPTSIGICPSARLVPTVSHRGAACVGSNGLRRPSSMRATEAPSAAVTFVVVFAARQTPLNIRIGQLIANKICKAREKLAFPGITFHVRCCYMAWTFC